MEDLAKMILTTMFGHVDPCQQIFEHCVKFVTHRRAIPKSEDMRRFYGRICTHDVRCNNVLLAVAIIYVKKYTKYIQSIHQIII